MFSMDVRKEKDKWTAVLRRCECCASFVLDKKAFAF